VSPSFTVSGTAVTVSAPGVTIGNTSTITVTPTGGFTGGVVLTAVVTNSPNGAQYMPTLSFGSTSPVGITWYRGWNSDAHHLHHSKQLAQL